MKIAIIGTGISGLTAAWLLQRRHDLTIYEAGGHIGGHTNTVPIALQGRTWPVDTGFIVFNRRTYPTFCTVLDRLGVPSRDSTMSFAVRDESSGLEWNGTSLGGVFAQRRNLLRPSHWGMLRDILRFAAPAERLATETAPADGSAELTLDEFLDRLRFGDSFRRYYLWPMTSAIWSMPPRDLGRFPARFLCRFLHNHGMLRVAGRPQWRTVVGGSWSYVTAMTATFRERIRLNTPVQRIVRSGDRVIVHSADGAEAAFDCVVLATHADQSLTMLEQPSEAERSVLTDLPYSSTLAVLHTDQTVMPRARSAWAAWNATIRADQPDARACLTYDMNILQGLQSPDEFLVSLGLEDRIDPAKVLRRIPYSHPAYHVRSPAAQARWAEISGADRIHYCGAYWGWGFHEDGCLSGLRVARQLGEDL
jgi:predicted NAD/FAD-binding protein